MVSRARPSPFRLLLAAAVSSLVILSTPARAAPPSSGDPLCYGPTTHDKHVALFRCDACHPTGGSFGFDVPYSFPRGTSTAGGVVEPRTATTPTTCTVGCHAPMGAISRPIAWDTPGPLACTSCHSTSLLPQKHPAVSPDAPIAECLACHQTASHLGGSVALVGHSPSWMDAGSAGFHAGAANQGLAACQGCHRQDLTGGLTGFSCAQCHDRSLPPGVTSWRASCVMCHGGVDNTSGAPPRTTWGNAADPVRIGAHTTHVAGGDLAPPFACNLCHLTPQDALSAGHIDGPTAEVVFQGLAAFGMSPAPTWERASASCANTYCHGGSLAGGTLTTPVWTHVGQGEAACGTCHGAPPPPPHPAVEPALTVCAGCHADTVDAGGDVIPPSIGGKHLDGLVEAAGHPAEWIDPASAGFHAYAANDGLAACQGCHGPALDGVGGTTTVACGSCHDHALPPGVASWRSNCLMCHGGADNGTGAPPRATWGKQSDPVRVGAHSKHVAGPSVRFGCAVCHVEPDDALSPGHIDLSQATVTFGGLAALGSSPGWNRATATCADTYCHGARLAGGSHTAPVWTLGAGEAACGTCHGIPPAAQPAADHPVLTAGARCMVCHPESTITDALGNNVIKPGGKHLDGVVDAVSSHPAGWYDPTSPVGGVHGKNLYNGLGPLSMNAYYSQCTSCHGIPATDFSFDGGSSRVSCGQCHPAFFVTQPPVGDLCGGFTTVPCTRCDWCHQ